jgi:hypothetical protein
VKTRIAIFLSLAVIGFAPTADAGPFRDFFRKVRHAINHPEKSSQSHRAAQKHTSGTQPRDGSVNAPDDHSMVSSPPSAKNTRTASAANKSKNSDLPYGTPVPGKKGFVTSPFAPDSGYVDVRGFNPGTEVKDPYSGKVFLTP